MADELDAARKYLRDAVKPLGHWEAFKAGVAPDLARRPSILALIEAAKIRFASLSRELARRIRKRLPGFGPWPRDFLAAITANHQAAAMVAAGTIDPSPADLDIVTAKVSVQARFFRRFRRETADGKPTALILTAAGKVSGEFLRRSASYATSLWATGEAVIRANFARGGYDEEWWLLSVADHCTGCRAQNARGFVPIGTLPEIGSQQCSFGCKCSKAYRHSASGRVVRSPFALR